MAPPQDPHDDDDATVVMPHYAQPRRAAQSNPPAESPAAPDPAPSTPTTPRGRTRRRPLLIVGIVVLVAVAVGAPLAYFGFAAPRQEAREQGLQEARQMETAAAELMDKAMSALQIEGGSESVLQPARDAAEQARAALSEGNWEQARIHFEQSRDRLNRDLVTYLTRERDAYFALAEVKLREGDVSMAELALSSGQVLDDRLADFQ